MELFSRHISYRISHRVLVAVLTLVFAVAVAVASRAQNALPPATEAKIRALIDAPQYLDAQIGVCIARLGSVENAQSFPSQRAVAAPILFAHNDQKRFLPASNMKLFTASIALEKLGENRTFATRVAKSSTRSSSLYLIGGGDPSLTLDDLKTLARAVRQSGVKSVKGVFADNSLFQADSFGGRYPDGWTLDDATWYYGPEVSALALERNQIDITISATREGQLAKIEVAPQWPGFEIGREIINEVRTVANPTQAIVYDRADANSANSSDANSGSAIGAKLTIRGEIAPGASATEGLAIPNVSQIVAQVFARELRAAGVRVRGEIGVKKAPAKISEIASHESQPLRVLVNRFLKKSDNLYGEMLLRDVGVFAPTSSTRSDATGGNTAGESVSNGISSVGAALRGHRELLDWLDSQNVATASLRLSDGSGLSRYNLMTPRAIVELLRVDDVSGKRALWDALPIAGVDGTLARRMKGTLAENNARAKTGTFSIASCLSGYVTTRDKQRLAVSVLTNFVRNGDDARALQNEIFASLAQASWNTAS